ncbi:MAG TPA: GlsB/YeaQ/YmgE family stress response membrane protein [Gemmatimonadales bacterium]|nr:GlsB/YeaQ/YmgE family stress response membrane protein [Gemmatimonadales bacterium]
MAAWLSWILLGLVAGALAKFLVPGRDPTGCIVTVILGIVGAFVGGWIGTQLGWGSVTSPTLDLRNIGISTFGAVVILLLARMLWRR